MKLGRALMPVGCRACAALLVVAAAAPALAADWPQFRGPTRDGKSAETGLLKSWPEGGPRRVATIDGVGEGYSSPAVAAGKVFVSGRVGDDVYLFCFDTAGKPLWRSACGSAYGGSWAGARSTPTVAGGRVFSLTGEGRLTALEVDSGRKVWSLDILERFGAKRPRYGVAESVMVLGDRVVCTPGGPDATLAALDAATGRTVWTSKGLSDGAAYASTIAVTWGGAMQIIALTDKGLVGVGAADGALLWRQDEGFGGLFASNILTPIFREGTVFADGGHYAGGGAVRLTPGEKGLVATLAWKKPNSRTHTGGYVELGGFLYGDAGQRWACIDLATGEEQYKSRDVRSAATLWADGRFYCLGEKGTMHLVEADPTGAKVVSEFEIPDAGSQTWAYPAIADGRLYIRRLEKVHVYDVAAPR